MSECELDSNSFLLTVEPWWFVTESPISFNAGRGSSPDVEEFPASMGPKKRANLRGVTEGFLLSLLLGGERKAFRFGVLWLAPEASGGSCEDVGISSRSMVAVMVVRKEGSVGYRRSEEGHGGMLRGLNARKDSGRETVLLLKYMSPSHTRITRKGQSRVRKEFHKGLGLNFGFQDQISVWEAGLAGHRTNLRGCSWWTYMRRHLTRVRVLNATINAMRWIRDRPMATRGPTSTGTKLETFSKVVGAVQPTVA